MNKKKILLTLLLILSLVACKNEEKTENKPIEPLGYVITLNAVVKQNDNFQLFYSEAAELSSVNYDENSSVRVDIIGNSNPQNIVFNLPEDVSPTFLRLDFGANKNQNDIQINNINIEYINKKFDISGSMFFDYFTLNENTVKIVDKSKCIIQPILPADGNYDPVAFSGQVLFEKLSGMQQ